MKTYPALDVTGVSPDLLLAAVDDFSPTALEEHDATITVYFTDAEARARARAAVDQAFPNAALSVRDVDDGDWARRSQENLTPIEVGRVVVVPPWHASSGGAQGSGVTAQGSGLRVHGDKSDAGDLVEIVIAPSMGFGTGHHATTRLCLAALQTIPLEGRTALDVGTGSGVLALAARLLGARDAVGLDVDPDAIQSAEENLAANASIDRVLFVTGDLRTVPLEPADVVTANLTGALLVQSAALLAAAVKPGGTLIVSGLLSHERDEVVGAFPAGRIVWEQVEDNWVGLALNVSTDGTVQRHGAI